ncbi:hypothetical protein [Moraxella catarrhalis]|uniref:hypothetical protein n=1 Tax=Moraxella catarrhalis TaxID=480 RepID=UPI00128CE07E|nr:hypothetical protein [Moraxella catarrhalis]MPW68387.1 hypothetical protein [Moraxella catarrhalis]MPX57061.1 hypothetical protein [Moraxella catarrhalis]
MNTYPIAQAAQNPMNGFNNFLATVKNKPLYQSIFERRKAQCGDNSKLAYYFTEFNGMIFVKSFDDGLIGVGYANKAKNPAFRYFFKSLQEFNKFVQNWANKVSEITKRKQERQEQKKLEKQQMKNAQDVLNIDDVFKCAWGYEQTNVDYYQVVGFKGKKTVLLRKIAGLITEYTHYEQGTCKPCIDNFIDDEILEKRIDIRNCFGKTEVTVRMNSFATACLKHKENGEYKPDNWTSYY